MSMEKQSKQKRRLQNQMEQAAVSYAKLFKWPVFPLHSMVNGKCTCGYKCSSPGKHPRTKRGLYDATNNIGAIRSWEWGQANIGVPTGRVSGFIALDIDPRHGGNESIERLILKYGGLPDTVEALTGGGGRHILFKYPGKMKNKTNILPGLDIRGDGGYIVVAPSIHTSGKTYEWELSSRPDEMELADVPEWLLKLTLDPEKGRGRRPNNYWLDLLNGVDKGERNNATASLTGYLLRHGISAAVAFELVMLWNERNNPPEDPEVVEATFNSILKKEITRRKKGVSL
ncbi:bifunctional DNA primase/polymerase [Bacillus thermotolerans]|uniref:bifunctional DNA primase/polymerase n=1 Tax=Bacillus thermotolerans TaxID=1221996 RepID=UPI000583F4EE|nr:bifunctional DNA primase/polymerase [Bacillus thermotolerans]KKB33790.1 prophage Lp4 protein 7, DNA replication [Bacillus thermotolerans]